MDETALMELSLLGGFAFSVRGAAVAGISAGSERLLAYLAVRDRWLTRAEVAGALWPESTGERAGSSLRSAVTRLNNAAPHALRLAGRDLGLGDGVVVDIRRSDALAQRLIDHDAQPDGAQPDGAQPDRTDLGADALSVLSEDLLPGWYDDWAVIAAEGWRQRRLSALEALAARLTAAGRLPEAGAAALAAVSAEPLRESPRAALICVHLAEGNVTEAVGEFERYRALLRAELGLEPTSRLSRLVRDLGPR
jgi:DNA-binding SARP family transcriptional activator